MKKYNYDELIAAQKLSRKQMDDMDFSKEFNERWNLSWATNKPVRDWCEEIALQCFKSAGMETMAKLHDFVYRNDMNCRNVDVEISSVVRDDDEFKVSVWLDYDCDTTMAKFFVRHKPSGLGQRSAVNLGAEYLQHAAICIEIKA